MTSEPGAARASDIGARGTIPMHIAASARPFRIASIPSLCPMLFAFISEIFIPNT